MKNTYHIRLVETACREGIVTLLPYMGDGSEPIVCRIGLALITPIMVLYKVESQVYTRPGVVFTKILILNKNNS